MKTFTLIGFLLLCVYTTRAQRWQGQIGTNLATLPGRSLELTSAWSPHLNQWALTFNAGYTHQNAWGGLPSGMMCDCGVENLKTSGAFFKAGYRFDLVRRAGRVTKVGLPIGVNLIGSHYRQTGTIESFPSGTSVYRSQSVSGFLMGLGITATMNIRFSARWNLDLGVQKFIGFQNRTDYFLFKSFRSHQPGVGLLNSENSLPGLQGIVGLNYRLGRL
ncbi:hypothetical protein GCM10028803_29590 [Larkinella knui]|uniref:DUF3575 domain-containing protein n=1 Tax=Larkinella knui TaxID=2025310 RepID=A0A3P1CY18_9BACT|nr:hypothetical protein [Larkinella knui]RRB17990.1 hypothetical protein EHT87_06875 [Larkinella knui]